MACGRGSSFPSSTNSKFSFSRRVRAAFFDFSFIAEYRTDDKGPDSDPEPPESGDEAIEYEPVEGEAQELSRSGKNYDKILVSWIFLFELKRNVI